MQNQDWLDRTADKSIHENKRVLDKENFIAKSLVVKVELGN